MKASKLIKELQAMVDKHGDLRVLDASCDEVDEISCSSDESFITIN